MFTQNLKINISNWDDNIEDIDLGVSKQHIYSVLSSLAATDAEGLEVYFYSDEVLMIVFFDLDDDKLIIYLESLSLDFNILAYTYDDYRELFGEHPMMPFPSINFNKVVLIEPKNETIV